MRRTQAPRWPTIWRPLRERLNTYYEHNPGFLRFVQESGLPFTAHEHFKKADLDERGLLYRKLAERIWNPDDLLREVGE